jgi:hypothetical protein
MQRNIIDKVILSTFPGDPDGNSFDVLKKGKDMIDTYDLMYSFMFAKPNN